MVLPNLIHPIDIEIQQISRSTTIVDPDFDEPVENVARAPTITCKGQVKWEDDDQQRPTKIGSDSGTEGYMLFRRIDLRNKGIPTLNQGDRFISIGSGANKVPIDVFVVKLKYIGGYTDRKGSTMVKAFFRDRHPAKQTKGG